MYLYFNQEFFYYFFPFEVARLSKKSSSCSAEESAREYNAGEIDAVTGKESSTEQNRGEERISDFYINLADDSREICSSILSSRPPSKVTPISFSDSRDGYKECVSGKQERK